MDDIDKFFNNPRWAHNTSSFMGWVVTLSLPATVLPHTYLKQRHGQSHQGLTEKQSTERAEWRMSSMVTTLSAAMLLSVDVCKHGGSYRAFVLHSPLRLVPSTGKDWVVTVTSDVP